MSLIDPPENRSSDGRPQRRYTGSTVPAAGTSITLSTPRFGFATPRRLTGSARLEIHRRVAMLFATVVFMSGCGPGPSRGQAAGSGLRLEPRERLLKPTAFREQPASCYAMLGWNPLAHTPRKCTIRQGMLSDR